MKKAGNDNHTDLGLFLSLEWSPPVDATDLDLYIKKAIETCKASQSKFCAISWHCTSFDLNDSPNLKFASKVQENDIDVIFHLTSQNLERSDVLKVLNHLKKNRIKHIFALRGDVNLGNKSCFPYARDLVSFIRENFGSYFIIFVAGYPSGHPEELDRSIEIQFLKEKVDAGANYIITQTVFDATEFVSFVKQCRSTGIKLPIIPGILPIQDADLLNRLQSRCKFPFTNEIRSTLLTLKDNEEELINYGIQKARETILEIIASEIEIDGVHFFTLNRPNPTLQIWKLLCQEMKSKK